VTRAPGTPQRDPTALLLALLLLVVPAVGVPHADLLQGSLKAIVVVFFTLAAALAYCWPRRGQSVMLVWHWLIGLPLALLAYALGSMFWSHTYLASIEAVRWAVFGLLLFLGMNVMTRANAVRLAWGIHAGAVIAALWTALQFWFDWQIFPQAAAPASTFANRNFFAEYLIATLPFSVWLMTTIRHRWGVFWLVFSMAFNVVALMMTGTRSALVSLLILGPLLLFLLVRYRAQWLSTGWRWASALAMVFLFVATVGVLGSINTTNAQLAAESGYGDAIDRTLRRSLSMTKADEYSEGSSSQRLIMWKGTLRLLAAHPFAGVGAGAWEVQIPRYQDAGSQVEYSDYPHNEFLQLLAEYGAVGWLFIIGLLAYLLRTTYTTWRAVSEAAVREAPLRAFTLASLLAQLLVSNAGFPWHMATTIALLALSLALLGASDARLPAADQARWVQTRAMSKRFRWLGVAVSGLFIGVAIVVTAQAVRSESQLLQAGQLAEQIAKSSQPQSPNWTVAKARVLTLLRQAMAINPHQRQLSAEVADAMASWGDTENATVIWKQVLASRPNIVVMLAFVARAHVLDGEFVQAQGYLDRALALQPGAPVVQAVRVMLLNRSGQEQAAMQLADELLRAEVIDPDLVSEAYSLGTRLHRPALAILALQRGIKAWPERAADGWWLLGGIYDSADGKDQAKALRAFQEALALTPLLEREQLLATLPQPYRAMLSISRQ